MCLVYAEVYSGSYQTSMMEFFTKIVNDFKQPTIFAKKLHHRCLTRSLGSAMDPAFGSAI